MPFVDRRHREIFMDSDFGRMLQVSTVPVRNAGRQSPGIYDPRNRHGRGRTSNPLRLEMRLTVRLPGGGASRKTLLDLTESGAFSCSFFIIAVQIRGLTAGRAE